MQLLREAFRSANKLGSSLSHQAQVRSKHELAAEFACVELCAEDGPAASIAAAGSAVTIGIII